MVTIGIPRAGCGQSYGILWKTFFEKLGFNVLLSPETTKEIVDNGVKHCDTDICFAIKIYVGHVLELKNKVDYIFVPSISDISEEAKSFKFAIKPEHIKPSKQFLCSYHTALPYLIKNMFPDLKLLEAKLGPDRPEMRIGLFDMMSKEFKKKEAEMQTAIKEAWEAESQEERKEIEGKTDEWKKAKYKIALVGADYISKDKFCLMNIPALLKKEKAILRNMNYPRKRSEIDRKTAGFYVNWEVEQDLIDRYIDAVEWKEIDGIIYIMPFSCGPCFLFQEQVINEINEKPVLILNVDESQNETRIKTRIEAFMDVIKGKKK
jgi:predicted nucleotide-binding protein (sugar kinase/HSP70/actin superfamily)